MDRIAAAGPTRKLLTTAVAGALCLCFFGNGEAYRFFAPERDDPIVTADDAVRWSRSTWDAGAALPWTLDTSADWSKWFGSSAGARRVIEQALTAWSDLPDADIRWEVAEEARSDYGSYGPRDRSANWVSINPNGQYGGAARLWSSRSGAGWRITGCTIVGGSWLAREPPDWWKELDDDDPDRLYPGLGMWIHEFGHCLGLLHSQRLPTNRLNVRGEYDEERQRHRWYGAFQSDPWISDPQMSYGWSDFGLEHPVTADDAVGAALLRPARGWLRRTGAISGSLRREGRAVRYAHVWAFPADAMPRGGRPGPVGVFSDREGDFLIEGLAPGRYVLWASPLTERPAHHRLSGLAGPSVLDETVLPYPVRVTAGSVTEGVSIPVRRGRECRAPAPCGRQ